MTIGPDIKTVFEEVGISYTILRDSGNITGEYTMVKANSQVTKPFIREFFLEGYIVYDSQVVNGDVIEFGVSGKKYLVMNKTPDSLEDEVFRYAVVFYLCNVVADILRPSDRQDERYRTDFVWTYIARQTPLLITTPLYGHELSTDDNIGAVELEVFEMYAPSSIGIKALDRILLSSNEYYKVETVKPWRYEAVDVFGLGEDSRGITVTTTTSTTSTTTTTTAP